MADSVVTALVEVIQTGKRRRKLDATWTDLASTASPEARRLLEAIATSHVPTWQLGCRFLVEDIETFAVTIARTKITAPFDPASSCELGGSFGEVTWGFAWTPALLTFVEVDSVAKTLATFTPGQWFAHVRADEFARLKKHEKLADKDLIAFAAACGHPIPEELQVKPKRKSKR